METDKIVTKQQKRADFAFNRLKDKNVTKELANFIVGTPNMVLSNGLGQTMAFLMAKMDKEERKFVFETVRDYLRDEFKEDFNYPDNKDFMNRFNKIEPFKYVEAQNEVLRMLEWLKRYARAFEKDK